MTGFCQKCNKPLLERYNGQVFCPKCGQSTKEQQLSITEENEAAFRLSELCFLRYLSPLKGALQVTRPQELLQDAIRLCTEAASSGHPKALFRMGFYHEFYMKKEKGEVERVRRAFDYYWRVCDPDSQIEFYQLNAKSYASTTVQSALEFEDLKKQAALHILGLFSRYPHILEVGQESDRSNRYKVAKKKLTARYAKQRGAVEKADKTKRSRVSEIYRVLSSCYDKKRPPLFGMFLITGRELRELLALRGNKSEGRAHDVNVICEHLLLHYLVCDADGTPETSRQGDFIRIREGVFPTDIAIGEEDHLLLAFFNKDGKHVYLSSKQIERVRAALFDDDQIIELVSGSSQNEILLFCEDIVWLTKVKRGNMGDLIADICREG